VLYKNIFELLKIYNKPNKRCSNLISLMMEPYKLKLARLEMCFDGARKDASSRASFVATLRLMCFLSRKQKTREKFNEHVFVVCVGVIFRGKQMKIDDATVPGASRPGCRWPWMRW
jgi:hypothetical protein